MNWKRNREIKNNEDPTHTEFDSSLLEGNTVHRGIGDSDEEVKGEVEREELEYDPDFANYTQFFSTSSVDDLWSTLASYITNITTDYKFSADDYSISAKVVKESSDDIENIPNYSGIVNNN